MKESGTTTGRSPKVMRSVRVRIIHTLPGSWTEEMKLRMVNKQFSAKEVMEGGVSSFRVNGVVFWRELREQDQKLHDQLMMHDPQLVAATEVKFKPSLVQVIDQ